MRHLFPFRGHFIASECDSRRDLTGQVLNSYRGNRKTPFAFSPPLRELYSSFRGTITCFFGSRSYTYATFICERVRQHRLKCQIVSVN